MPSTTTYDPGDVLLVDYRHTDGQRGKQRPVVVVSTRAHNAQTLDLVAAQVTSQLHQESIPGSVLLKDWQKAGLIRESVVKPVLASYTHARIKKRLGKLSPRDRSAVRAAVARMLGLVRE